MERCCGRSWRHHDKIPNGVRGAEDWECRHISARPTDKTLVLQGNTALCDCPLHFPGPKVVPLDMATLLYSQFLEWSRISRYLVRQQLWGGDFATTQVINTGERVDTVLSNLFLFFLQVLCPAYQSPLATCQQQLLKLSKQQPPCGTTLFTRPFRTRKALH
jgi:hypothetical protein